MIAWPWFIRINYRYQISARFKYTINIFRFHVCVYPVLFMMLLFLSLQVRWSIYQHVVVEIRLCMHRCRSIQRGFGIDILLEADLLSLVTWVFIWIWRNLWWWKNNTFSCMSVLLRWDSCFVTCRLWGVVAAHFLMPIIGGRNDEGLGAWRFRVE